ncbi:MAG: ArsR family transcriptional regulator [Bacteroidetes bacterium]|jgi:predicted nucleotidyltransferase|nr:ArsR family transcriptional regulator [Bacteroidota bacterium]MCO5278711.1 ArsR family transcriptional regulator [Saprospiraceae bacterium]
MSNFATHFMIDTLISSKTRVKLLFKFFLNKDAKAYLRGLESEMGESSNAIRLELNKFEKAGLLNSAIDGNKKYFSANTTHPLFREIHNILLKHIGIDQIIDNVIERLGDVVRVYLSGTFARGIDGPIIDLILIGTVERDYLTSLITKAENIIQRKIRYVIFNEIEYADFLTTVKGVEPLLLWSSLNNNEDGDAR